MKFLKKLVGVFLAATLLFALAACGNTNNSSTDASNGVETSAGQNGNSNATYKWKAANVLAGGGAWAQGLEEFARLLNEKSNGAIELEVFNGGTLGQERDTVEGLQLGTCDFVICSSATLSNFTDTQNIFDLPFLFETTAKARGVLDSEVGTELLATLSDVGIKGLSYWENGMYILGSTKPITKLEDMKGLKVRTIESNLQADIYGSLGATSVVVAWGEVYTALQTGACDVTTTTLPNMYSAKQNEVAKYITQANQIYGPAPLLMSQKTWESLPEDIQKIVQEAADEAKDYERQAVDSSLNETIEKVEAEGCEVLQLEDMSAWVDAVSPVYEKYVGTDLMGISQEIFDKVKAEADKY